MTPLQTFVQHCQALAHLDKLHSKHWDRHTLEFFEGDWANEDFRLLSQKNDYKQQLLRSVDATAASVDDDTALVVLGIGIALRDENFKKAWKEVEPKLNLAAIRQSKASDRDDELITTYEAKKILGTKSDKSLTRWAKDNGIERAGRGKWRKEDILRLKRGKLD